MAGTDGRRRAPKLGAETFTETFGHLYDPSDLASFLLEPCRGELGGGVGAIGSSPSLSAVDGDDQAGGYAKVGPPHLPFEPRGTAAELRQLYLLEPFQGRGLADQMMQLGDRRGREAGRQPPLPLGLHRQSQGAEILRALGICCGRALRLHGRKSCRRGYRYAAAALTPTISSDVEVIKAASLEGVPHGFLGRRGGVSEGVVAGLNVGLGSGDDRSAIAENRRRAVDAVLPAPPWSPSTRSIPTMWSRQATGRTTRGPMPMPW